MAPTKSKSGVYIVELRQLSRVNFNKPLSPFHAQEPCCRENYTVNQLLCSAFQGDKLAEDALYSGECIKIPKDFMKDSPTAEPSEVGRKLYEDKDSSMSSDDDEGDDEPTSIQLWRSAATLARKNVSSIFLDESLPSGLYNFKIILFKMNKQEKLKPSNVERYKAGESKFHSMEQSRQLRAIKKKLEQKSSRDAILNKMRRVTSDTPHSKSGQGSQQVSEASSSTKKFSKRELKELGIKRYEEMLKWKDQKRKLLEQEKKARKPVFKTGVVVPDKPQYLQDVYVEKKEQTTPFKFAVVSRDSSTKKSSIMKSASKENIFGRSSSRMLSFHSGATPQTSGGATSASNIRGTRRANRVFRPPPRFGITPLPKSPSLGVRGVKPIHGTPELLAPSRSFNILKQSLKSFAPSTFNFQAPKGLQRYTNKQSSVFRSIHNSPSTKEELEFAKEVDLHNFENDESEADISAERLENNEFERSSLRDTYLIDNNKKENEVKTYAKDNELETDSLDNETETCSINSDNREDNDDDPDSKENLLIDNENDTNYAREIQRFEEKINEKSSEKEGVESNFREEINEQETKLESGQEDRCSEDDEHEDILESEEVVCSNEENEHENKSEPEEKMECSSEDLGKKIMVQDINCDLSGFEEEESNSATSPTLSLGEEKKGLTELSKEKKENTFEEKLRDYKLNIEKNNKMKEYLEDNQENISDKKANIKSSTKKRSKSLAKITPPLSKLRPRTPCSRSTRRSLMAHCNSPCVGDHYTPMTTPLFKRRKSKRSLTVTAKIDQDSEPSENFVFKAVPEINTSKTPSQNPEDDILKTPLSDERLRELECSPWITRSRGSDSSNSSKRKSVFKTVIEKETRDQNFDKLYKSPWISKSRGSSKSLKRKNVFSDSPASVKDFCIAGSPALNNRLVWDFGSPSLNRSVPLAVESFPSKTEEPLNVVESVKNLECDVDSPLLKKGSLFSHVSETSSSPQLEASLPPELVQLQKERISESPDVCVWGPETPANSPVVTMTQPPNHDDHSEAVSQNTEAKPMKPKKRSSRRVSLLVNLDKENADDVSIKYPVTPRRKSLRISSVINQRVSLLPGLYPHDENTETSSYVVDEEADLILLESPAVAPQGNERLRSRLSQRVSLLPGLSSHPEEEDQNPQSPVNEHSDLITLNSPLVASGRSKSRKKSNVDTPLRRSRRFSKN